MASGATVSITITVVRDMAASFENTATVTSDLDLNAANDSASVTVGPAGGGTPTLSVSRAGTGSGIVTSSPAGIDCGADCAELYPTGTIVNLTATPGGGSTFTGWSGACSGSGACQVTMNAPTSVTATFTTIGTQTLTVATAGTGTGSVNSTLAGINCPGDCSEPYATGTVVNLTASPSGGSTFAGWSGACSGTGACEVTMNTAKSVTATFSSGATTDVFPSSFTIEAGSLGGGTAASLNADDDNFLIVRTPKSGSTATWYGTFTGVSNGVSSLAAAYQGKSSVACTQMISIFRWTDATWVQLASRSIGTTEVLISGLSPSGTLADFVSNASGTGDVRIRVSCTAGSGSFNLSGDLMKLTVG
jgi:hypothetical protein